jgi:hypothetical protein
MSLEEAILERVRRLPPVQQEEVLRFASDLEKPSGTRKVPMRDRSREVRWIDEHRTEHAGQWVALEGERLIAADADAQKVYAAAIAEGIASPFVVRIPPDDASPFVPGW